MSEDKLITALNGLLKMTYDAEEGYRTAVKDVDNLPLKEFFKQKAHEKYDSAHVLQEEITALGSKPEKGSTLAGDLHHAWTGVKAAVAEKKYQVVLTECEKEEDTALKTYDRILKEVTMPERTRENLLIQYRKTKENLEELKKMQLSMP